jgi:hypothetical protein
VSADDARRRSEAAVRRIRQESGQRIAQRSRVRAFSSWCALATLASGISLAALEAYDARLREDASLAAASEARSSEQAAERARAAALRAATVATVKEACARRAVVLYQIRELTSASIARARSVQERRRVYEAGIPRWNAALAELVAAGCESWAPPPPPTTAPAVGVKVGDGRICSGLKKHPRVRGPVGDDPLAGLHF